MSLADVCWNISSVFIVITLGVIAILCVLMLLGVFVCIFDHDDNHKNDKNSKGITIATNVTQKDKTLNEIMAWCDQLSMEIKCTEDATTDRTYGKLRGLYLVYEHCQNMLGYSGTMPSEVPNQSEDAKE